MSLSYGLNGNVSNDTVMYNPSTSAALSYAFDYNSRHDLSQITQALNTQQPLTYQQNSYDGMDRVSEVFCPNQIGTVGGFGFCADVVGQGSASTCSTNVSVNNPSCPTGGLQSNGSPVAGCACNSSAYTGPVCVNAQSWTCLTNVWVGGGYCLGGGSCPAGGMVNGSPISGCTCNSSAYSSVVCANGQGWFCQDNEWVPGFGNYCSAIQPGQPSPASSGRRPTTSAAGPAPRDQPASNNPFPGPATWIYFFYSHHEGRLLEEYEYDNTGAFGYPVFTFTDHVYLGDIELARVISQYQNQNHYNNSPISCAFGTTATVTNYAYEFADVQFLHHDYRNALIAVEFSINPNPTRPQVCRTSSGRRKFRRLERRSPLGCEGRAEKLGIFTRWLMTECRPAPPAHPRPGSSARSSLRPRIRRPPMALARLIRPPGVCWDPAARIPLRCAVELSTWKDLEFLDLEAPGAPTLSARHR